MRDFIYDGRSFPDPDPNMSVEEVKARMADFFPELANADVHTAQQGENTLYEFIKRVGVKG